MSPITFAQTTFELPKYGATSRDAAISVASDAVPARKTVTPSAPAVTRIGAFSATEAQPRLPVTSGRRSPGMSPGSGAGAGRASHASRRTPARACPSSAGRARRGGRPRVAGERHDARFGVPEALGNAADGAPVRAAVEEVSRLEERRLDVGEAPEDWLGRRDELGTCRPAEAEPLGQAASPAAPVV